MDVFDNVQIPTLYGVSAIGTKLCIYTYCQKTGDINPEAMLACENRMTDGMPTSRWKLELLSLEGEQKACEVVAHVKSTQVLTRGNNQCWYCGKVLVLNVAYQISASRQLRVS